MISRRYGLPLLALLSTAVMGGDRVALADGQARGRAIDNGVYVVQMRAAPVVAYTGEVPGYRATKPAKGQKIDPNDPHVINYVGYLDARHDDALAAVGGGRKLYDYRYTFNGFAAQLTAEQAAQMAGQPGVTAVTKDELRYADTSSTPTFLGLDATLVACGTSWEASAVAGDGIIIGVVDSGIWPESLSFSDRTGLERQRNAGREAGLPADPRLARQVHARRGLQRLDVQPEADRRAVVQRRLGRRRRHRGAAALGVQLTARLQRPRHAHVLHSRREQRRADDRPRWRVRPRQRHGAARPHRDVQGPVVHAGCLDRPAASRPTSSRRSTRPSPTAST